MSPSFKPIIRKCSSFEEMRELAIADWQALSAYAREEATWQMVREAWILKNKNPDELRLQRTVTVLRKAQS